MEQGEFFVGGGVHVAEDVCGTGSRAEEGDVLGVTTKARDVVVNPLEGFALVTKTVVADAFISSCKVVFAQGIAGS